MAADAFGTEYVLTGEQDGAWRMTWQMLQANASVTAWRHFVASAADVVMGLG